MWTTHDNFWKLSRIEDTLTEMDVIVRGAQLKVHSKDGKTKILKQLFPLELEFQVISNSHTGFQGISDSPTGFKDISDTHTGSPVISDSHTGSQVFLLDLKSYCTLILNLKS